MKREIIETKDGINWVKFHLSPVERLVRFGRLLPDLLIPDFWDGDKLTFDSPSGRWETFTHDLKAGVLGYWIGCQPSKEISQI